MGFLTLPRSSLIFIDANVVIYSVEKIDPYWSILQPLWASATAGEYTMYLSPTTPAFAVSQDYQS